MNKFIVGALKDAQEGLQNLLNNPNTLDKIESAATAMAACLKNKGRIFSCGNGGSMCDAMHFAEELTGRYRKDRPPYAAMAISDASHLACVGNDYGYEFVFSRFIEAHGRPGDVLLAISTSGTSKNVLHAADAAKKNNMQVVALTGKHVCPLGEIANFHLSTPAGQFADRVQELHIKIIHIMIELIERSLSPQNYS